MPPTAATAAARDRAQRRTIEAPGPAPRIPRRVSGPVAAAEAPARRRAPARAVPREAPRAVPRPAPREAPRAVPRPAPRSLPRIRLLPDRLIRGRAWIPVLGILLAGIVAMRVEILKLNVSVGRSVALAGQLQGENQVLRANVANRSNDARIEALAQKLGMTMPGPLDVHFVQASGARDLAAAASGITRPDPETFESDLQAEITENADSISAVAPPTVTAPTTTTTPAG